MTNAPLLSGGKGFTAEMGPVTVQEGNSNFVWDMSAQPNISPDFGISKSLSISVDGKYNDLNAAELGLTPRGAGYTPSLSLTFKAGIPLAFDASYNWGQNGVYEFTEPLNVLMSAVVPVLEEAKTFTFTVNFQSQALPGDPGTHTPLAGVGYSPFRNGQSPNTGKYPTLNQISSDLTNIVRNIAGEIRTFGMDGTIGDIPMLCATYNINCYPCAWLDSDYPSDTMQELSSIIAVGNAGYPTTKGLIVGSEALQGGIMTPEQLISSIQYVRSNVPPSVQITTADTWNMIQANPAVVSNLDFITINIYPYWEDVSIENAAQTVMAHYNTIVAEYPGKRVVIGEVGWPTAGKGYGSDGTPLEGASPANQSLFLSEVIPLLRANNVEYFAFEPFDEGWKPQDGAGTVEAHWGLFNSARAPKQAITKLIRGK